MTTVRALSLLLAALLAYAPAAIAADGTLPRLKTQGNAFATESGAKIDLRGVSLCSLEWHKPLEQIAQVTTSSQKWNANILRLPIQYKEWKRLGPQGYIKAYLDPAVEMCSKNNVYCILDWHRIGNWKEPKNISEAQDFWRLVAPRYARNPNIAYEVFNEPTQPSAKTRENWLAYRAALQPVVDLIRLKAPDTLLFIGSPHWSQMPGFAVKDPFRGGNLAYTAHVYPNYKPNQWDKLFGDAAKTLPVFLSEWGWSSQDTVKGQVTHGTLDGFGQPLKDYLNARPQIGWTAWSYDPKCGPAMLGSDREMGDFVEQWLSEGAKP